MEKTVRAFKIFYIVLGILIAMLALYVPAKIILMLILGVIFITIVYVKFELSFLAFLLVIACVPHNQWNNLYMFILMVLCGIVYILKFVVIKNEKITLSKLSLSLFIFMLSTIFAGIFSYSMIDSVRVLTFFAASFIAIFIIVGMVKNTAKMDKLLFTIFIGVVLTSVYAIYQGITGVEVDPSLVDLTLNDNLQRVFSTMDNPNNFAEYLVIFMPFCAAFILNRKKLFQKIFFSALFMLPIVALVLTYSRSSWLALCLSAFVFICFVNWRLIPVIFVLFIATLPFLPQSVLTRISTIGNLQDTSNAYRIYIWEGTLRLLKQYFFSGIGLGQVIFSRIYPSFANTLAITAPHSHFLFLEVWVEMGIVAVLSFIWTIAETVKNSYVYLKRTIDPAIRNVLIASISSILGIMLMGTAEYVLFYPRVMFYFFVALGITLSAIGLAKREYEGKVESE